MIRLRGPEAWGGERGMWTLGGLLRWWIDWWRVSCLICSLIKSFGISPIWEPVQCVMLCWNSGVDFHHSAPFQDELLCVGNVLYSLCSYSACHIVALNNVYWIEFWFYLWCKICIHGQIVLENWFSSGFSRKKIRKIHEQIKMTTELFVTSVELLCSFLTLHPTPTEIKGSPKGWWQFSLLEYLFSALRSWWKTCSMGRNCLGVILLNHRYNQSQSAYKIISTLFPTRVFFWSLSYPSSDLISQDVSTFSKWEYWEIETASTCKMFLNVTFHLTLKDINKIKYDMCTM